MLTESSKPTMAKNASVVAGDDRPEAPPPSLPALNSMARADVALAGADGHQADDDDDQQAGQLDAGKHDIEFHALADAAEVDRGHQRHETERRSG